MTLAQLNQHIVTVLTPVLGASEAKATARLLLEDDLKVTPTMLFTRGDRVLEPETVARYDRILARISAGEPPQYVIGSARFMGMDLKVTPATLIPRPETAELVDMITDRADGRTDLRILDIGTGSGCIAIALSRAIPFCSVEAIDISSDALAVARENGKTLHAPVDFRHEDILHPDPVSEPYDIIVSNPPYIAHREKAAMEPRVKDYEPASALFVPDSDPLVFYRAIARYASTALKPGGFLALEINPLFATDLQVMLAREGFTCEIVRDSFGKKRFAFAVHAS